MINDCIDTRPKSCDLPKNKLILISRILSNSDDNIGCYLRNPTDSTDISSSEPSEEQN